MFLQEGIGTNLVLKDKEDLGNVIGALVQVPLEILEFFLGKCPLRVAKNKVTSVLVHKEHDGAPFVNPELQDVLLRVLSITSDLLQLPHHNVLLRKVP